MEFHNKYCSILIINVTKCHIQPISEVLPELYREAIQPEELLDYLHMLEKKHSENVEEFILKYPVLVLVDGSLKLRGILIGLVAPDLFEGGGNGGLSLSGASCVPALKLLFNDVVVGLRLELLRGDGGVCLTLLSGISFRLLSVSVPSLSYLTLKDFFLQDNMSVIFILAGLLLTLPGHQTLYEDGSELTAEQKQVLDEIIRQAKLADYYARNKDQKFNKLENNDNSRNLGKENSENVDETNFAAAQEQEVNFQAQTTTTAKSPAENKTTQSHAPPLPPQPQL
ncbi:hypothetical protein KUTeg_001312 [Tegillarca granosa]|uniref:Uncharacterized protein n=1 Tax=Tegillarca granosa TaxID=220873 RepID=A0ABQ9FVB3_TEGGR|nr:hypothetical protein KUTeg_001312 [Tegillarca granosa]